MDKAKEFLGYVRLTITSRVDLTVLIPGLIIYIILMAISTTYVALRVKAVQNTQITRVFPKEFNILLDAVQSEQVEALKVLGSPSTATITERDVLQGYDTAIGVTLVALTRIFSVYETKFPQQVDNEGVSPYMTLDLSSLEEARARVRRRQIPPLDAIATYRNVELSILESVATFSTTAISSRVLWSYGAVLAARLAWQNAELQDVYTNVAAAVGKANSVTVARVAQVQETEDVVYHRTLQRLFPDLLGSDRYAATFAPAADPSRASLLAAVMSNTTWAMGTTKDIPTHLNLLGLLRNDIIQRFDLTDSRTASLVAPEILMIIAMILAGIAIAITCYQIGEAAHTEQKDKNEKTNIQALEDSHKRIETFVGSICAVDGDNIKVQDGKLVQNIEHDIYSLDAPARQIISFLHPAVSRSAATGLLPPPGRTHGAGAMRHAGKDDQLFRTGLTGKSVTLLFISTENCHARPTTDSVKTLPKEFLNLQVAVCQILDQFEGVQHCSVGCKIIAMWNHNVCYDSESTACQAAVTIQKQLPTEFSHLRFAVVSGDAAVGICGTDSLKAFALLGQLLPLGAMLLRLNRIHNTTIIVNDVTFGKLDAQSFRTRPLEMVALESTLRRSPAFELVLGTTGSDKDGRFAAWNEAFDEYRNGNTNKGKSLLKTYISQYGESKSARRLLNLMSEEPPRHWTCRFSDDGVVDPEFL